MACLGSCLERGITCRSCGHTTLTVSIEAPPTLKNLLFACVSQLEEGMSQCELSEACSCGLQWRWVHFKLDSVIFIVKLYSALTYRLLLCFLLSLLSNLSCWKVTITSPTGQFLVKLHLHFISSAFMLLKTASLISRVHKLQFFCFEQ